MRPVTLLLSALLLLASPAAAWALGPELDSENQVQQYGQIFGYACGVLAVGGVLFVIIYMFRGAQAEARRGKRTSPFQDRMLDEAPKKPKPAQVLVLGERVPEWKIDNRLKATLAGLKYLARKDEWFDPKYLRDVADRVFRRYKECQESRTSKKVEHLLTPDRLEELRIENQGLRNEGKRHVFGDVEVTGIEVVHFDAPKGKKHHTFTALISAKSKDYVKDEESGEVLRGDKKMYMYQEFWTFRRFKEGWLVDRIRSSGDMDRVLGEKLVLAQSDLDKFAKSADAELLREFVGK